MVLPGEITGRKLHTQCSCGKIIDLKLCRSAAGYYLGYTCPECGPYGRETGYYKDERTIQNALFLDKITWRDAEYHG